MDLLQSLINQNAKFLEFQNYNYFCDWKAKQIGTIAAEYIEVLMAYNKTGDIRFADALEAFKQEHGILKEADESNEPNIERESRDRAVKIFTRSIKKILSPNYEPPIDPLLPYQITPREYFDLFHHLLALGYFYKEAAPKLPEGHMLVLIADESFTRAAIRATKIIGRIKSRGSDVRFRQPKATKKRKELIDTNLRKIWEEDLSDEQRNILSFAHPYSLGRIMGECWDRRWTRDRNEKFDPAKKRGCPDINSIVKRIEKFREIIFLYE